MRLSLWMPLIVRTFFIFLFNGRPGHFVIYLFLIIVTSTIFWSLVLFARTVKGLLDIYAERASAELLAHCLVIHRYFYKAYSAPYLILYLHQATTRHSEYLSRYITRLLAS